MSVRRLMVCLVWGLIACNETRDPAPLGEGTESQTSEHRLRVTRVGPGQGFVRSEPAGISCAPDCEAEFSEGVSVELIAEPVPGSTFGGWSGECAGATPTCRITMHGPRVATVQFFGGTGDAGVPYDGGVVINDSGFPGDAAATDGAAMDSGAYDAGVFDAEGSDGASSDSGDAAVGRDAIASPDI